MSDDDQQPLGNSLDLPYEDNPGGPILVDLDNPLVAGGLVVKAAVIPSDAGTYPALVFQFHLADGTVMPPVVLVANADQMGKLLPLVASAVAAAIKGAERAS